MDSKINIFSIQDHNEWDSSQKNRYYSVEFTLDELVPFYQFKLRNSESIPLFVLIRKDSEILNRLEVGRVLKMKYYSEDISCPPEYLITQINNICTDKEGPYSGHCVVGLSILPNHQNEPFI